MYTNMKGRNLKLRGGPGGCQTRLGLALAEAFGIDRYFAFARFVAQCCWSVHAMDSTIEVQGKQLKLSNLEKVLYPATGFTKQQVIDYYVRIAPAMVPHLAGRPLTRKRYPNGVDEEFFYEKNAPQHRPDWVKTAPIWSARNRRTVITFWPTTCLRWSGWQIWRPLNCIPSLALAEEITCPTMMVFDLDPGPPANIVQCCQVGLWLRDIFEHFGLQSFPKTSGRRVCRFTFR
jgi:bifunctional non-homologous end joining protein LigD